MFIQNFSVSVTLASGMLLLQQLDTVTQLLRITSGASEGNYALLRKVPGPILPTHKQ